MGLDLVLGGMLLIGGVRGWFRGFLLPAIRLAGLVGCVYLAGPLRDLAKPRVQPHLPSVAPELLDKLLWWASATTGYVVMVGLATLLVKVVRRRPPGVPPEPYLGDQSAGIVLGLAKAFLVAAFLAAAIDRYALSYLKGFDWVEAQVRDSQALVWSREYRPAERIWASRPVQTFLAHVKREGLAIPAANEPKAEALSARTDGRNPALELPKWAGRDPNAAELDPELEAAIDKFRKELRDQGAGKSR